MLPVILAMAGGAIVGAVVGVSAEKKKLLEKPVYRVVITHVDGKLSYITGTLLSAWGSAASVAATDSSIVSLALLAPDNSIIRTWQRPAA